MEETNKGFVALFVFVVHLGPIIFGYASFIGNSLTSFYNKEFNWVDELEQRHDNGLLNSSLTFGMMVGCLQAGLCMRKYGRRKTIILSCITGISGIAASLYMEFYA